MHCSIASVRLNNVSSVSLLLPSNLAPRRVSYQRLLQTIGVLEAQRTQAILDLEMLARHQREALGDPIGFVEQLQKRVTMQWCSEVLYIKPKGAQQSLKHPIKFFFDYIGWFFSPVVIC